MLVDPQHQYIVFLKQFLKGGFYTGKIWALPTVEITCTRKRRVLHTRKGKFLFHSPPCIYAYYSNSSVYIFHCLSKERFLHRTNRRISTQCALSPPLYPIRVLGCTMISKREVSTPEKPAIVISTYVCTAEHSHTAKEWFPHCPLCNRNRQFAEIALKTEILPRQKRGFHMHTLVDSAVAISFHSLLNLLHPVWKPLSPSVFFS